MKTSTKTTGIKVTSAIKAGKPTAQQQQPQPLGLKVKSAVRLATSARGVTYNRTGLKVRSAIQAGGLNMNHSRSGLKVRSRM